MDPDLKRCVEGLTAAIAAFGHADPDRSRAGKWSIAQVLEHLDLTYTRNAAAAVRRIAKGEAPSHRRSVRQIVARLLVVRLGHFPTGRKSPEGVVPKGRPFADVAPHLESHLRELDARLNDAERAFGSTKAILDHPVMGPFSVSDWRRFHWVHTRHHLRQLGQGDV